jgi:hypothetical protein
MTRKSWCLTLGTVLALGGSTKADDGPCKEPRPCYGRCIPTARAAQEAKCTREQEIERRLRRVVSLNFMNVPLGQIVDDLRALGNINVALDRDALQTAGIDFNLPLSLKVEDISLRSALHILLHPAQLTFVIKDEVLQITTREAARGKLKTVTYPVADLVVPIPGADDELAPFVCRLCPKLVGKRAPGMTAEDVLIRLITQTIDSKSWIDAGGKGIIQYFPLGLALVVNQTADVQEQIADLLAALRRAQAEEDREVAVEACVITKTPSDKETVQLPKMTFVRGQRVVLSVCDTVAIRHGSIRDWLSGCSMDDEAQEEGGAPKRANLAKNGILLRLCVTKAAGGKLKLDATFEKSEIVEATRTGMQITGQTCRMIQHVASGDTVKMVLTRDERGSPRSWVALTLTELPVEEEGEPVYTGCLPPIPR